MNSHFWVNYSFKVMGLKREKEKKNKETHLGRFTEHEAYNVTSK